MHGQDLPNLFIIGAPKCGTTSLFRWLASHPEVCASDPKETYFFTDREIDFLHIEPNHRRHGIDEYLSLFGPVDERTQIKMEGSTHYLYSERAISFVGSMSRQPNLIVQLRNPAARIWSHYNYIRQTIRKPLEISFVDYVDSLLDDPDSTNGSFTDQPWQQYLLERQLSFSNYGRHLDRWLERVDRDHIKILVLEDMAQNRLDTVSQVATWIGVDPGHYARHSLTAANRSRSRTSHQVRRSLGRYSHYFPKPVVNAVKRVIDQSLVSFAPKKSTADDDAIAKLEAFFAPSIDKLERDFDLDLTSWRH